MKETEFRETDSSFHSSVKCEKLAYQVVLVLKNLPANARDIGDPGSIPGWEAPLEEDIATHSSILAWRIP